MNAQASQLSDQSRTAEDLDGGKKSEPDLPKMAQVPCFCRISGGAGVCRKTPRNSRLFRVAPQAAVN